MSTTKAAILAQLQKDILPLQGLKQAMNGMTVDVGLGAINNAFPNGTFAIGAVHEFCCARREDAAATGGFMAGILASLMSSGGVCLWISSSRTVFPIALDYFGIEPDKIIFIDLQKDGDVLWAMEEALKCGGLAAVVGEMQGMNFTASRRLQLSVEQSRVTGFILYKNQGNLNRTACVTRWKINSLPSVIEDDMPGVGFPRWNVELTKVRNGKPGSWQVEWSAGNFKVLSNIAPITSLPLKHQKKTG